MTAGQVCTINRIDQELKGYLTVGTGLSMKNNEQPQMKIMINLVDLPKICCII